MPQCYVCSHPRAREADRWLIEGRTHVAVAKALGLSRQSVNNHVKSGHVAALQNPPAPPPTQAKPPASRGSTPEDLINAIVASLDAIDMSRLPLSQQMDLARERRLAAEALAKLVPAPRPTVVTVKDIDGYADLEALEFAALEPFPEARKALAAALRKYREDQKEAT